MTSTSDKTRSDGGEKSEGGNTRQFLTFTIGHEEYGVDIMTVREIKGWTEITRLPNSPDYMRGVMNLRGIIIPIYDLRARFTGELTKADVNHVVIILSVAERNIGILVDSVSDILTIDTSEIKAAPDFDSQIHTDFITGIVSPDNRMVVFLSVEKLFGGEAQAAESHIQTAQ